MSTKQYSSWKELETDINRDKAALQEQILILLSSFEEKYKQHCLSITGIRRKADPDNLSISKAELEVGYTINAQIG